MKNTVVSKENSKQSKSCENHSIYKYNTHIYMYNIQARSV